MMSEISGFFADNGTGDREYTTDFLANWIHSFIGNGVYNGDLAVTAGENMQVIVPTGQAWINGYYYKNDANVPLAVSNADGLLQRKDIVVLRWDVSERSISAKIITGSFSNKPVAPAIVRNAEQYDLKLAEISISAGATAITQANITDTRSDESVCGFVIGVIQQLSTATLFQQFTNAFNTWFQSMKNQLSTDAAGNLQKELDAQNIDVDALRSQVGNLASGSPKGVYATLDALEEAYSSGAAGIYVVLADSKWYYWANGSKWVAGGTYIGNIGNFDVTIPYCTAAWDSANSRWVISLPSSVTTPSAMSNNMMMRINFESAITWPADGTLYMKISGMNAYTLTANVGTAYYGKTLAADTYTVLFNGVWVILDAAQKIGCDFANPVYVSGKEVADKAYVDGKTDSDATVSVKKVIADLGLYSGGDADTNKVITKGDLAAVNGPIKSDRSGNLSKATAADMSVNDAGGYFTGTKNAETVTQQLGKAAVLNAANIIANGNFSNGSSNWNVSSGATLAVSNQIASFTAAAQSNSLSQALTLIAGHKYYVALNIQLTTATPSIVIYASNFYGAGAVASSITNLQKLSFVSYPVDSSTTYLKIQDNRASGWDAIKISCAIVLDLTALFGAGNEPSAAQMDALLANNFDNSWFDGTANLFSAKYTYNRITGLDNAKADKVQEAWITPTLINGSTAISGETPQYMKDSMGFVHTRGAFTTTTTNPPFYYATGYKPNIGMDFICYATGGAAAVRVINNGGLYPPINTKISLNNIIFRAEA